MPSERRRCCDRADIGQDSRQRLLKRAHIRVSTPELFHVDVVRRILLRDLSQFPKRVAQTTLKLPQSVCR